MPAHQYATNPNAKAILIVCDEGNNRSVTIAGQLKYWGHDCLSVGRNRNRKDTIEALVLWSDLTIATDKAIVEWLETETEALNLIDGPTCLQLWDIGEDKYPRPYNKELLALVKTHIEKHRKELAPIKPNKD